MDIDETTNSDVVSLAHDGQNGETEKSKSGISYKLDAFSGPLDLLLFLVQKNKINIYDIPISEITEQYLAYIHEMLELDLEDITEFYIVAAWLLLIKSRTLLPVHADFDDDEIDTSKSELINTLIEYQKYRKLSDILYERYDQFNWLSLRQENNQLPFEMVKGDMWRDVKSLELFSTFLKLMDRPPESQRIIDLNEPVTINEKIALIYEKLEEREECMFEEIIAGGGSLSIVCSLLALLELMKQQQVRALQHVINGDIKILRGKSK